MRPTSFSSLLLSFVKRRRHNLRGDHPTANVGVNLLADVRVFRRHVSHTDIFLEVRRGASRRDVADFLSADVNVLPVARDASLLDLEADELATDAFLFLPSENVSTCEVALV